MGLALNLDSPLSKPAFNQQIQHKYMCMYLPTQDASEFLHGVLFLKISYYYETIGSLSNYDSDNDNNDDFKKTIGLMIKTTALHEASRFFL